jgi:hypothetical protein
MRSTDELGQPEIAILALLWRLGDLDGGFNRRIRRQGDWLRISAWALLVLCWAGCKTDPPVVNVNTAPTQDGTFISAFDIEEGSALDLVVQTTADAMITTSTLPRNAIVKDGIFSFTPDYSQAGLYSITFTITSGHTTTTKTIGVRVLNVIHIASPPITVLDEGSKAPDLTFASDDPPGTVVLLTADLSDAPAASFDPVAGKLSFAPGWKWLDSRPATLAITVIAQGQELDSGKERTSTARVIYQINEATSFKEELVPLFKLPPGATNTLDSAAIPPPDYLDREGHNCLFCHDGKPGAFAEMDFTPDNIYTTLVNHDVEPTGINSAACGDFATAMGIKRVVPGDLTKSLFFMKISGTDGNGHVGPPCGFQDPFEQDFYYLTVTDYDAWLRCPPGVTSCHSALNCSNGDIDCKLNARLVRKAANWIKAGAMNN